MLMRECELAMLMLKLVTLITDYTDGDFCIRKMEYLCCINKTLRNNVMRKNTVQGFPTN